MNLTVISRKAVYRFLYQRRVDNPHTYYDRQDLAPLAEAAQLEAALSFGLELEHLERYHNHYYRLTAVGMLFVEQQGWMEDD